MSDHTLFLLQSEFAKTKACLEQLSHMATLEDCIVLMGDAVLFTQDQYLQQHPCVYLLETDLDLMAAPLPKHVKTLSYAEFADLVLDFKRCISLK